MAWHIENSQQVLPIVVMVTTCIPAGSHHLGYQAVWYSGHLLLLQLELVDAAAFDSRYMGIINCTKDPPNRQVRI